MMSMVCNSNSLGKGDYILCLSFVILLMLIFVSIFLLDFVHLLILVAATCSNSSVKEHVESFSRPVCLFFEKIPN